MFAKHPDQARSPQLTIGRFAEIALLSPKALRIYAERGLLEPEWIDPASGYRYYTAAQAPTGRVISMLRAAGVSLEEIGRIVHGHNPSQSLKLLDAVIGSHRQQFEASEALLRRVQDYYLRTVTDAEYDVANQKVVSEIVASDEFVLSHLSPVILRDLDDHMQHIIERLERVAVQQGLQRTGCPFGIFHGPVGDDTVGPLEIALPVSALGDSSEDIRSYRVQGGQMACISVKGPDTDYPTILTAYDRACAWIERKSYQRTGPPRELWQTLPWEGTAHMIVAWPFVDVTNTLNQPEAL